MSRTMPTQDGVGYLLNRASRGLVDRMSDQLRPLGLDHDMWMMIQIIRRAKRQCASPVEAAESLVAAHGSMIDAAARLVRDGWAEPVRGEPADAGRILLTDKAKKMLTGIDGEARWLLEHATSGLTNEDLDQLADYLKRIIKNLA